MCRCTKEWRRRLNCTSWSLVLTSVCECVPCDRLPQDSWRVPSPPPPTSPHSLSRPPLLTLPRHTTSRLVFSLYWHLNFKTLVSIRPSVRNVQPHSPSFFWANFNFPSSALNVQTKQQKTHMTNSVFH